MSTLRRGANATTPLRRMNTLAALRGAKLAYRRQPPSPPRDLTVARHSVSGGHALLGANGCGKTLASLALLGDLRGAAGSGVGEELLHGGSVASCGAVSRVSFESHKALLAEGGTVYRSLGALGPAARYLIVRFGLHPILYRPVRSISSGEIKKVLLAKALASKPELLVLDNAFDGLDVPSRTALKELVSQTLRGFSQVLVQGVDASAAARTQVLLLTHRHEELVPEIATVSIFGPDGGLTTAARDEARLASLLGGELEGARARLVLPPESEVAAVWPAGGGSEEEVVSAHGLRLLRGEAEVLQPLDWRVRRGEHWLIAGGNGAGKSSLSRLLAAGGAAGETAERGGLVEGTLRILGRAAVGPDASGAACGGVGWISTERHLAETERRETAGYVLNERAHSEALSGAVARWLRIDALLARPFCELSQGEQKLVLIGTAVAEAPRVLVADEPCTSLDASHRARVLGLFEALGAAGRTSLVYITHHPDEVLPCISHVLHLRGGGVLYTGGVEGYAPPTPPPGARPPN